MLRRRSPFSFAGPQPKQMLFGAYVSWRLIPVVAMAAPRRARAHGSIAGARGSRYELLGSGRGRLRGALGGLGRVLLAPLGELLGAAALLLVSLRGVLGGRHGRGLITRSRRCSPVRARFPPL